MPYSKDFDLQNKIVDFVFERGLLYDGNGRIQSYAQSTTFTRLIFAFLLRAGYILVQIGSVPTENVHYILLQNFVDIAVCLMCYGLIGYAIAFGRYDFNLSNYNFWRWKDDSVKQMDFALFGFSANLIASAIITTFLSARLHFFGYFLVSFIFSLILHPFLIQYSWSYRGFLKVQRFAGVLVSVKDTGGGLTIHIAASTIGLVGCFFLGRRLLRLKDIDKASIGRESLGTTVTGYIMVMLGLMAFSMPTPYFMGMHAPNNYVSLVLFNNLMAIAGSTFVVILLHFIFYRRRFNHWIIIRCVQGALAGIVAVSSGIDVYVPPIAFLIGLLSGVLFFLFCEIMHNSFLEDYCNIIPTNLMCGILAVLAPPLLGSSENLGTSVSIVFVFIHFAWQIICLLIVFCQCGIAALIIFFLLKIMGILRSRSEYINHMRSEKAKKKAKGRGTGRLFRVHEDTPYIEPAMSGKKPDVVQGTVSKFSVELKPTNKSTVTSIT